MCLYPKLILNPKYKANKKNGGNPAPVPDERVKYVPIGCQECKECRKQKQRDWQVRMSEEIRENKTGKFITLTFSNEKYTELYHLITEKLKTEKTTTPDPYTVDNLIATYATRHFLENWRSTHKKSLKHWLVTELGHKGTENIHLPGS